MINCKINLYHFTDENKIYFLFAPQLDVVGYGKTEKEASESFYFVLNDSKKFWNEKKCLQRYLGQLGWIFNNESVILPKAETYYNNSQFEELTMQSSIFKHSQIEVEFKA